MIWQTTNSHGHPFVVHGATNGPIEMSWQAARFRLSADRSELMCARGDTPPKEFERELLDTVLVCTALLRGRVGLHAAAAAGPAGAVAVVAPGGGGKSSLASTLVARGWSLVTDDVLIIADEPGRVECGPPVMSVPSSMEPALGTLGQRLACFEHESWLKMPAAAEPSPELTALILLDRTGAANASIETLTPSPWLLLPHSLAISDSGIEPAERLGAVSRIVDRVPILRLRAAAEVPPATLADMVISSVTC